MRAQCAPVQKENKIDNQTNTKIDGETRRIISCVRFIQAAPRALFFFFSILFSRRKAHASFATSLCVAFLGLSNE